ncbi:Disulfide-bond oxidoreductase YfcG [Variovorax sp. SRS16]|uniref:glutathione S-transferase N-terminal domain-containing protein n=1 Tax=Variovorax sp. SRS16 TaxID=282217 RepID=UPI0013170662|nr:glutathione S-transferase N-terminal domain-containing protein [Variovorax sp. SRS16]VTU14457.1 Disulfide-bond oxidoreductase YfcG [Variovorax sp. SRS16]
MTLATDAEAAAPDAALDLHYWPTPNGWKISILLEELGVPYRLVKVDIRRGDQFEPAYLRINPNNRIPALVDHAPADGGPPLALFESGAIMMYLADKHGRFWSTELRRRHETSQWLMWQMSGLGPTAGQVHHFNEYAAEPVPYAIDRFNNEIHRLYGVLERRLADRPYLAGDYSIADIACWVWVRLWRHHHLDIESFPALAQWLATIAARPAVNRGFRTANEWREGRSTMTPEARAVLLGQRAR